MGKKIKVGLIGIGNCFSGLIQGIEFYAQNPSQSITGIIHEKLRDYGIHDIEFVCGFDVGENKVGKKINEAIYEKPNMVNWIPKESMPKTDALVYEGPAEYGLKIKYPIKSGKTDEQLQRMIIKEYRDFLEIASILNPKHGPFHPRRPDTMNGAWNASTGKTIWQGSFE